MSGVFCQFSPQDITFVATDAHKLVRYRRTDSTATGSSSFILPKKPLNLLKSNLSGAEEVLLEYNESNAIFTFNDIVLICRLIDGKYPNYEAVIPKENPNVLIIDRAQFLSSIKRVSIFANKTTHQIRLKLVGSELSLFAEDIDFANEATERLTCNYDGVNKSTSRIGSHVRSGSHNVFVAPITIGDGAYTAAGTVVRKDVAPGDLGMNVAPQRNIADWVISKRPGTKSSEAAAKSNDK
jgi:DNA polymerase-3 subunit beta